MSFSDLFDSEFKQRNRGHFSSIVRVALTDEKISPEEKAFVDKLAVRLEISPAEYEEILQDPLKYPINPPYLYEQRIERLYDLARIVHVDHHLGDKQELMLRKIGIGIGFDPENINQIVENALLLVEKEVDLDTFITEIQNINT
ncbi:TerB family tellurite resistance protein [Flavobacterium sp. GSP27]|uniref:TerB family tellurite resistance protein n=1 Tax=unclassified Flavobacterium TaxID=196869 RepID=UPI000F83DB32|nr:MULTISPECIES: TerB family tellurite resistance protein [unclassified Flavobacterium]RTY94437.1 TerB family tellurite resistance protein [Flavobacterium sp. GSN2]RTY70542.1 TerB family tellurite resistance protein [Flavobacterium sp. LB2P53]RTY76144.1 TerB family tellurite resistance protein [Flavobacterium sp. LS1R10]RTY82643.1 TerB family tellurite resistance protein [Flavobacterium sp. ZB4P23]RTY85062.1 TerB family tellurite resistance protein [Flavobacterium sp. LS1P28]